MDYEKGCRMHPVMSGLLSGVIFVSCCCQPVFAYTSKRRVTMPAVTGSVQATLASAGLEERGMSSQRQRHQVETPQTIDRHTMREEVSGARDTVL